jgi:hypothetical protein
MTNSIFNHALNAASYGIATAITATNPIVGTITFGTSSLSSFVFQQTIPPLNNSREDKISTNKKASLINTPISIAFTHGTLAILGFATPLLSTFALVATADAPRLAFYAIRLPECSRKNALKIHTAALSLLTAGLFLSGGAPSLGAAFILSSSISFTALYVQKAANAFFPEVLPSFLKL